MGRKLVKTSVNKSNKSHYDSLKAKTPEAAGSSRSGDKPNPSLVTDEDIVNDTYVGKSNPPPTALDIQKDVPIENDTSMETDNTDFIVIPRPSPFACAATISKNAKELPTPQIIRAINNAFAQDDAFRGLNVRRVNFVRSAVIYFDNAESMQAALPTQLPELGIEKFVDYNEHKDNTQFQNRTLRITDIHLSLKKETITSIFSKYGTITNIQMHTRDLWQHAFITYDNPDAIKLFYTTWSRYIYNDCVRVYPACLSSEEVKARNEFRAKLTNLPFGTSARDLTDILLASKAKACYIPRSNNYKPRPFAILYFESANDLKNAINNDYAFGDNELQWRAADSKCCHKCGSVDHIVMKCPIILEQKRSKDELDEPRIPRSKLPSVQRLYNHFKPVGSRSLIVKKTPQKTNDQQSPPPPKSSSNKGKGTQTVDDSIHNPKNTAAEDTNKKLDKILDMLTKMQKDMAVLEARILKLEKRDFNSDASSILSTSNIPSKPASHDLVLNFNQKKRTRIANSSSDENASSTSHPVDPKIQAYMDEQNAVIGDLHKQLKEAMTQITLLANKTVQ